jgi:hypothetical protein
MLIYPQPQIRDLDEQIADMKAGNRAIAAKSRFHDQDELEDVDRAIGARRSGREFASLLQICFPFLLIKEGLPGSIAVYRPRRKDDIPGDPSKPEWYRDHVYVTGFSIDASLNEYRRTRQTSA